MKWPSGPETTLNKGRSGLLLHPIGITNENHRIGPIDTSNHGGVLIEHIKNKERHTLAREDGERGLCRRRQFFHELGCNSEILDKALIFQRLGCLVGEP